MSRKKGQEGEDLAACLLENNGYTIKSRNYLTRFGEIDIIAHKEGTVVFVEVKYRQDEGYGAAVEFVTSAKLKKIIKTAKHYLYENNLLDRDWRIDVVAIEPNGTSEILQNVYIEGF